jgi:protease-4
MKYNAGLGSIAGLLVFLFLLAPVLAGDTGGDTGSNTADGISAEAEAEDREPAQSPGPAKKTRYLELSLFNQQSDNFFANSKPPSPLSLLQIIKKAEGDNNIRGIILNTSGFNTDRTTLWELRNALETFKTSGKKVVAFFDTADFDLYCLLSVADRIIMDGQGTLAFTGYVYGRGYYRSTLEKLGIGVRELRYFNYKSAMESYTRSDLSDADRRQYGIYLDDIFSLAKETVMKARSLKESEFNTILNREFLYSAEGAKNRGLVDAAGRAVAVIEAAEELEGRAIDRFVLWGDSSAALTGGSSNYRIRRGFGFAKEIAIVYANGETDLDRAMNTRYLASLIGELAEKRRVKAIVVRINSPGGSAEAADYLAEAIRDAAYRVPVVVSMGPVAASGGYWASMYASHIVASPFTYTGSIGVIAGWFYDKGIYNKLGVGVEFLRRGDHADLGSGILIPSRDLTAAEQERYRQLILDSYNDFVRKAAEGRHMPVEDMEKLARGRVYSGIAARDNRLIDSLGGLGDALEIAKELAGIPENQKIIYTEYPKPSFMENFIAKYLSAFVPAAFMRRSGTLWSHGFSDRRTTLGRTGFFEGLKYRLSQNGKIMPILSLEAGDFSGMPLELFTLDL